MSRSGFPAPLEDLRYRFKGPAAAEENAMLAPSGDQTGYES